MFENDRVTGLALSQALVRVDLEVILVQFTDLIILILEIDAAVIIRKGPCEGEAIGIGGFALDQAFLQRAAAVRLKNDGIIDLATGNAWIEGIEDAIIVRIESRLFIFPGAVRKHFKVMTGGAPMITGYLGQSQWYDRYRCPIKKHRSHHSLRRLETLRV
jgi:hypothetical protein